MAYDDELRRVREAKARFGKELLENPDVHGIGIGYRRRDGKRTDELAIVVHVQTKSAKDRVEPSRLLPASVTYVDREGQDVKVPVDVVERPVPVPEVSCGSCSTDLEDRVRPVPGGFSGGPPTSVSTGGTLGGWVWDTVTDQAVVISNDHVFGGTAGTDISQPSIFDGGALPADRIADVVRSGTLDVSIAAPVDRDVAAYEIECGGPGVYEIAEATVGMVVQKTGQTTGLTCGIVELIDYDSGHYGSNNDLWIDGDGNDFSMGGDSGSLYLERDHPDGSGWRRVVGLHWGGAGDDGVGHPIREVFDDMDLTTVCSGTLQQFIDALFRRDSDREVEAPSMLSATTSRRLDLDASRITAGPRLPVRWYRPRRVRSFARAVEARMSELKRGKQLVDLLQRHRVLAVKVLRDTDGRRATAALLEPLRGSVTTDDVLAHKVTRDDLANVKRMAAVLDRVGGKDSAELAKFAMSLTRKAEGRTLAAILR
ncbi:S1 family peptidase [Ornithinimicrobium sediminis]|uniref:S1 family peptidase n=1 Tax=Ornithinimicrobium sediminis TaxID=2904603 RepID=UPI001E45E3AB|nr:S1 family peptidase [Ornithinimicrobium sediminis]MCE0488210.1 S1 family peptidase [Ornithinimicrobium sediminis]